MARDEGTIERTVLMLIDLLETPFGRSKEQLGEKYNLAIRSVEDYFKYYRRCGLILEADEHKRYRLKREQEHYRELKDLLHFTEEDQLDLYQAIDNLPISTKRQANLKRKLSSVYDFRRLGHAYLSREHLTKLDLLEKVYKEDRQIILRDYRSTNSSSRGDRLVEIIDLQPAEDTFQAFDVEEEKIKVFKISRIGALEPTQQSVVFKDRHHIIAVDPFRIYEDVTTFVHIIMDQAALNDLQERFPRAAQLIREKRDGFHLQCEVNYRFIGLTNFLLGCPGRVRIVEPAELRVKLREIFQAKNF